MEFLLANLTTWWSWSALGWAVGLTVAGLGLSLLLMGVVVVRLPDDYFSAANPAAGATASRSANALPATILKNLVGLLVVAIGIMLCFLPGQGILTVLVGVMICDFPGKRRLERRLVGWPGVLPAINALRRRWGKNPLVLSPPEHG